MKKNSFTYATFQVFVFISALFSPITLLVAFLIIVFTENHTENNDG